MTFCFLKYSFNDIGIFMNKSEHNLTVVIEELSEIILCASKAQQAACKAQRFGLSDGYPGTDRTNGNDLVSETNDLIGALESFTENELLHGLFDREAIESKKRRIAEWRLHAQSMGTLS